MYKIAGLLLLCSSFAMHSADTTSEGAKEAAFIKTFLETQNRNAPRDYGLYAVAKTHDSQYLVIYKKYGNLIVKMGPSWWLQDVTVQKGSFEEPFIGIEGAFSVNLNLLRWWLITETKKLTLVGGRDKVRKGVLDNKDWSFEDVEKNNPNIPKEAWLELLQ